ncbi:hypothetical protein, partial [Cnuella takakiae]
MKRIVALLGISATLWACGDNNVGNRTYQKNTQVDSANVPIGNPHDDTTATINNNAYNPDSMPPNTTIEDKGGPANRPDSNQARISAGASIPQNNQP